MNIHEQAADIHRRNHKWWHDKHGNRLERNRGELLMLVVSELAEAMEALRKDLMDDKLPHRKGEEVELADAYIRLLDFSQGFGIELEQDVIDDRDVPDSTKNKAESLFYLVRYIVEIESNKRFPVSWHISAAISCLIDYCEYYGLDLQGAVTEKLAYNDTREDHTWEAREAVGGKKF